MLNNNNNITLSHSFNSMSSPLFTQQQHDIVSWSVVKEYISECWLQFYGPLFWIIHLILCNIELRKSKKHLMEDHYHICQTIIFEENQCSKLNPILLETTKKENNEDPMNQINQTDVDDDSASSSSSSNQSPKSSFKHSLKGHLKSIKQKAMKKSILRKSSKQSLMNQQEELSPTSTSPLSSSLPNSPLSSSILLKNESTMSLPSTTLLNEQENFTSFNDNKQPVFTPSLDRRPSFSDSLLKSFGKKKKQPSSMPFPMNLQSNHNYNNSTTTTPISSSSTISFIRRETAPELYTRMN